jgi:photosystem II stability/assembly factor-like uncharacterized protein
MEKSIVLGTRKGTLILRRNNGTYKVASLGHSGVSVAYAAADPRDQTLWAALDHGHWGPKLSRSKDGGASWEDAPPIKYPAGARMVAQVLPTPGEDEVQKKIVYKDASVLKIWVLAFGSAAEPGVMYAGTIPGGLFISRDYGATWELNRPLWNHESRGGDLFAGEATHPNLWFGTPAAIAYGEFAPGIHSIVVDPRDAKHLYVAVSSAGVIESLDGGETWRSRNKGLSNDYSPEPNSEWGHDVHFLSQCAKNPNHIWQQNHCGVFYSADGGAQWQKVSSPADAVHFGFPIAVDEIDGKTAWVVPGRSDAERMAVDGGLFVARTEDGGKSWKALRNGLPQQETYDVIYRHAFDVSGDKLCFGSTTGNVYFSEDRGESWICLGSNFPPVHSVRFAG